MELNNFTYGLFGGLSGTLISHPFDTIKTNIMTSGGIGSDSNRLGVMKIGTQIFQNQGDNVCLLRNQTFC